MIEKLFPAIAALFAMKKLLLLAFLFLCTFFQMGYSSARVQEYVIEVAHKDELFIINGEKFQAQTYCLGWDEGESVIFLEESPFGACASAVLYNVDRKEVCEVWCE